MRKIIFIFALVTIKCDEYNLKRAEIIEMEFQISLGGNTTLSDKELIVNECLMRHKLAELDFAFEHPEHFNFSKHFFKYKDKIGQSKVYQIIKNMPKGALLHVHDTAIMGQDYMLNITYMDNLYVCLGQQISFNFSYTTPNVSCSDRWQLMSDVRQVAKNVTEFDLELKKHFTIVVPNPEIVYTNINETWKHFRQYFSTVSGLLGYKPVHMQYMHDVLETLRKDKIMYAELRSSMYEGYDLNGTVYNKTMIAKLFKQVIDDFVRNNPDFFGATFIFAFSRGKDLESLNSEIQLARDIIKEVPELIVGFDLVGPEDLRPLKYFAPVLDTIKDSINLFLHAGETNWLGTATDENLIDAVLLGAKRIGHAYSLPKHPVVLKQVIENDIGLEVSVVSNSVLSLVKDVRNHPLSVLLSLGLPVVLASDDPGVWDTDPLSTEFYVAFVGVASRLSDLRMLKALALNSLKYSALNSDDKDRITNAFHGDWRRFVDNFDCTLYN